MSEQEKQTQENACTHDCSTCGSACGERSAPQSLLEQPNQLSKIGKVIAVVSGKGGVGKSLVSSMLAVGVQRAGKHAAILDADITGPSIPKAFGVKEKVLGNELGMLPARSKMGIDIMSVNLMLEHDTDPVVWRGPVIAGVVKQFWTDVIWDSVDYMFVDMPPGTGDVPLTVFQSIPIDGIVIVTSPQDLVSMIVQKAVKMANMMQIPVLGIIENMSYAVCPDCNKKIMIYGESHTAEIAKEYNIPLLAQLPFDSSLAKCCDLGVIELHESTEMDCAVAKIMGE
ncbi:MAG: Mrp/NBP35 family ATP-binding protein [Oscillospiraceae bacterium]|nr:Mrp/NBP35 family ATP-binding protein [Oscillospiraceae bacterium]